MIHLPTGAMVAIGDQVVTSVMVAFSQMAFPLAS